MFTNETKENTRKEELLKVQTGWAPLMLHGMWLGRGKVEGQGSGDPSHLPGSRHLPFGFLLLRRGVLLRRGDRNKKREGLG